MTCFIISTANIISTRINEPINTGAPHSPCTNDAFNDKTEISNKF